MSLGQKELSSQRLCEIRRLQVNNECLFDVSVGYTWKQPLIPCEISYWGGLSQGSELEHQIEGICITLSRRLKQGESPDHIAKSLALEPAKIGGTGCPSVVELILIELQSPASWSEGRAKTKGITGNGALIPDDKAKALPSTSSVLLLKDITDPEWSPWEDFYLLTSYQQGKPVAIIAGILSKNPTATFQRCNLLSAVPNAEAAIEAYGLSEPYYWPES